MLFGRNFIVFVDDYKHVISERKIEDSPEEFCI